MAAPIVKQYASWRPPQWSKPAMVSVSVPSSATIVPAGTSGANVFTLSVGSMTLSQSVLFTSQTTYVFDAVLDLEHEQALTKTNHPVQTGASVSSHAYIEPANLVIYVLMSDVSNSYSGGVNQTTAPYVQAWTGNPSKSVSAYTQMLTLQSARVPLIVTTRLRTYYNMMIARISPREDARTITGLRMRVEFSQVFIAGTQVTPVSARVNDTSATGLGAQNPQPPTNSINTQFNVNDGLGDGSQPDANMLNWLAANPSGVDVPGAMPYSSGNTNSLQQLPSP